MKKAFFTAVLLVLAAGIFAQQTRKAEVEVSYMIAGFIDVQTVTVDAKDVRDAQIQAYNLYQMFSSVLEVNFLRWLPAEKPAPQQQTQQPKAQQQQPQAQPQQPQNQQITPYQGTWFNGEFSRTAGDFTIIITNKEFKITNSSGSYFSFTIDKWTAVDNSNSANSRNFPSGYLLTGRVSDRKNWTESSTSIYIYLQDNRRGLIWSTSPGGNNNPMIFTKR